MPHVFIPSLREHIAEHGQGVYVSDAKLRGHGRFVCRDGAFYTADGSNLQPPPTSEVECVALQIAYWRTKLNQEAEDFSRYKKAVFEQAHLSAKFPGLPTPPSAEEVEQTLVAGKSRMLLYRSKLSKLQIRLDELTGLPKRVQAIQEAAEQRHAVARDIERTLNSVMLDSDMTFPVSDEDDEVPNE